ncbi:tyrosine-type recombinase/integrase [Sphingoaurantiacus capsulatus]|uniref:Tyrosine-type recombinase/integrase n=1 Tax=Sphingoaurantiacus capsulatus TaxID=1771310 RepID=A0ABV7XGA5_9SPHN
MPRVKLDHAFAAVAECLPGRGKTDYFDTGESCSGLVLEVRQSGGKTWYLRYQDRYGRQRQYKIGRHGDLKFEQVRKTAQRLRSEVVLGGDPCAEKAVTKSVPTYGELAQMHLDHAKTYQRSYSTTEMIMRRHIRPRWDKAIISEIHQTDVAKWLAAKREEGLAPATVEKIRVLFHRSFELALQWQVPGAERNPVRGVPRPRINNARTRFLSAEEAKRLHAAAAKSVNPQLKYIVGLLLLTGARVSELLGARWADVDLERRLWFIPMSKTGKSRYVPLSRAALDLLDRVPRANGNVYLFENPATGKPVTTIKHAWQTARAEARLDDVHIHDLRHSAASFMINAGIDLYAVGKILGHASHTSTARYSHVADHRLMAAVEAGAAQQAVDWL